VRNCFGGERVSEELTWGRVRVSEELILEREREELGERVRN